MQGGARPCVGILNACGIAVYCLSVEPLPVAWLIGAIYWRPTMAGGCYGNSGGGRAGGGRESEWKVAHTMRAGKAVLPSLSPHIIFWGLFLSTSISFFVFCPGPTLPAPRVYSLAACLPTNRIPAKGLILRI